MSERTLTILAFFLANLLFSVPCWADSSPKLKLYSGTLNGAVTDASIDRSGISEFAKAGGRVLRVSFANFPLVNKEPPFEFNENNFVKLDALVSWAREAGVSLILDPHSLPGTRSPYTTVPNDRLWANEIHQVAVVDLWRKIAKRYKSSTDVLIAYDLVNEPAFPNPRKNVPEGLGWDKLAARLIEEIRAIDANVLLIVEPAAGPLKDGRWIDRIDGLEYLPKFRDDRVIISPHVYVPKEYSHQGVFRDFPVGVRYPGFAGQIYWDKASLVKRLDRISDFQRQRNVPIYIGEFAVPCWVGQDGNRYLADLIEQFEARKWAWTIHAFRESPIWDIEGNADCPRASSREARNDRWRIIRQGFAK